MLREWFQSAMARGWSEKYYWHFEDSGSSNRYWWFIYTPVALLFIALYHFAKILYCYVVGAHFPLKPFPSQSQTLSSGISEIISDTDLKNLIDGLEENISENVNWENVIDKKRNKFSYTAKCCKPKDGPLKYISVTVFEDCSTDFVKDFYMDNDYRKLWDKMVISHERLQVDEISGTEIGRTIKKFSLLTPREYVLAWKLWEGKYKTFYCFIKECEHPKALPQKKYVRVGFFRSGWRIKKVPDKNACEIKMIHQEDAGLNAEMAKIIFANGIWSYVCKMESALRGYPAFISSQQPSPATALDLIQKVPPELESVDLLIDRAPSSSSCDEEKRGMEKGRPSKKVIVNGLIIVGGLLFLFRARSSLGAKVSMAWLLKKLIARSPTPSNNPSR